MAKMTISIQDDLKASMDVLEGVNWSGVAQQAFRIEVKYRETCRLTIKDTSDAVIRLLASRDAREFERRPEFYQAGIEWVMKVADYETLARCTELNPSEDANEVKLIMADCGSDLFTSTRPISAIATEAWHEGVMSVWNKISEKL